MKIISIFEVAVFSVLAITPVTPVFALSMLAFEDTLDLTVGSTGLPVVDVSTSRVATVDTFDITLGTLTSVILHVDILAAGASATVSNDTQVFDLEAFLVFDLDALLDIASSESVLASFSEFADTPNPVFPGQSEVLTVDPVLGPESNSVAPAPFYLSSFQSSFDVFYELAVAAEVFTDFDLLTVDNINVSASTQYSIIYEYDAVDLPPSVPEPALPLVLLAGLGQFFVCSRKRLGTRFIAKV